MIERQPKGTNINGYIAGIEKEEWQFFNLVDADKEAIREKWEQVKREREAKKQAAMAGELSLSERHHYNLQLISELSLSDEHRQLLRDRGLNDSQIDALGYRSINVYQKLNKHYPDNFPGYNPVARNLTNAIAGILCPIWTLNQISGFEIRKDVADVNGGRYRALSSSKYTSYHLYGEIPIAILIGKNEAKKPGYVSEGKGLKPVVAAIKHNIPVIGNGRYMQSSPNHAAKYLPVLREKTNNQIVLCPDAGDIINDRVWQKWLSEYEFYVNNGFEVSFAWWGQDSKEHNDIDEIENLNNVSYLTLEQIKLVALNYEKTKQEQINDINFKNWLKSRYFKAIRKVHQEQFQFPEDTPKHNAIIAVKSGLGTGKTAAMLGEIQKILALKGLGSDVIGYRNNLLFQTGKRGTKKFIKISHINEDGVVTDSQEISLMCCINSAHKLSGMFKGRDIYFDEIESVIKHLIDGGTFSNSEQKRAMNIFEEAVREANRVFLLDGNLTTATVNFIHSFAPDKELFTIENTKKIAPHNIFFVDGGEVDENGEFKLKPRSKSHLITHLSSSDTIPFIATDSKKFAHELQEYLIRAGKVGIVISADTVHEKYAKEFLEDPNLYIRNIKPQFVIITPSCESGVSITEKYFTAKYTFFCGVLGTSSQHQMMFRLRDNTINHYVYCPESSLIRDNSIPMGYTQKAIQNALLDRITLSSLMCIENASFTEAKDIIINALEQMKNDKWFDYSCKLWGLANFERQNLRRCLADSLIKAGHNVAFDKWGINSGIDSLMGEIKEELLDKEAELQYLAVPYESMEECKEYENKEKKEGISPETRRRILKTKLLLETLPGIDKEECYGLELFQRKLKIRGYIGNNQNFARLVNFEVNQKKFEEDWYFKTTSEKSFIGELIHTYKYTKIAALHELKILELIQEDKEFTKDSPELLQLFDKVNNSKDLLTKLNINKRKVTESRKEVMELFKQLLGMIGLELGKAVKKLDVNNKRTNHYKIDWDKFNDPIRQAIVNITTIKDNEWLETHQIIPWVNENSTDIEIVRLKEQFRSAIASQDYSIYSHAVNELNSAKYPDSPNGRTIEQVEKNTRIDHIINTAWQQLQPSEQQAIRDLKPAYSNFMDEIDNQVVMSNPSFSSLYNYHKEQNTLKLWELRLKAALEIGKNFFIALNIKFFSDYPLKDCEEDVRVFEAYEKAEFQYLAA
ncbi:plasmid replication protein, CyRepA1 family [Richelia sinica]|uniref:plasmid replication protein, CyRepA1 family n=1 Tax=Richelia sinica TaxID=1357545 RepID=UPI0016831748|nr:plasmid replication protein, CyRepA1 family [Richelia sinica]MBD2667379.1 hypothetical protein [Richelia sinica FACHB-800]